MRLRSLAAVLAASALALTGCSGGTEAAADSTVRVGVTPQPHGEIMQYIKDNLAEQAGITIEIEQFSDYNRPNAAVAHGELDANYYQHKPFLKKYKEERGGDNLVWVAPVHLEPLSLYSKKHSSLQEIPNGATITIPNDPSNRARSLKLLADKGLITLKPGAGQEATPRDIAENPKNLQFQELTASQIPRTLQDAAAAVVNGNYALKADLDKPIAVESPKNNPYVNGLVTTSAKKDDPEVAKLAELLTSQQVADFIERQYGGQAVIPAS
ncbi:D-methionine transport system substrate-binding protein [Halopolyspora algeriensis]|uniref:Lipoprotein n=1 Tax=Halopolyspora algeriensis TaxID=1500506 RepID=A0A368VH09_9ACTN|nr:MetQ/NlpA family ABC transporter substrate-binding protein [Halopolyspora algeriensis]RCW39937.1 D-methionine transport system substrate-binding protein [Halopolyspora algeriensis]TQM46626.1 D-methionine transport system substrate-binding protein [Halopolyspora algeriensis]